MFVSRSVVDELDDPLSFYEQKISNQVQINNMLIAYETLEKAVENYKDDLRYQNAPRYLKLWLIYSFYQNNPTFVLQWLIDNCIGHKLSILYEATAYQYLKEGRQDKIQKNKSVITKKIIKNEGSGEVTFIRNRKYGYSYKKTKTNLSSIQNK
jgi:hypothetical protein